MESLNPLTRTLQDGALPEVPRARKPQDDRGAARADITALAAAPTAMASTGVPQGRAEEPGAAGLSFRPDPRIIEMQQHRRSERTLQVFFDRYPRYSRPTVALKGGPM